MWIGLAAALGLAVGEILRRRLNRLAYRLPPEDTAPGEPAETDRPAPGQRRWIPFVLAAAWAMSAWLGTGDPTLTGWVRLAAWLAFAAIGLWLAVIDLDVQRLPDRGQVWLAGVVVAAGILLAWHHPIHLLAGLGSGLGCGLAFWLIHLIGRGNLGFGDVKLIMTCGMWLGLVSLTAVFAALVAACVLALAYAGLARVRQFAFGPWLLAGTLLAGWWAAAAHG